MTESPLRRPPVSGRDSAAGRVPALWPAACAAWAVAAVYCTTGLRPEAAAVAGAGLGVSALVLWYSALRLGRVAGPRQRPPGRRLGLLLALALASAAAALVLSGAVADAAVREETLQRWGDGELFEAGLVLDGEPQDLGDDRLAAAATLVSARRDRGAAAEPLAGARVTLLGPRSLLGNARLGAGTRASWWVSASAPRERGAAVLMLSVRSPLLGHESPPSTAASALRAGLGARFAPLRGGPLADAAALVPGMVVGDRSGQDADLEATMQRAGLSHLTAVSGANVALLLGGTAALARLVRLPRALGLPLCLATLCGFVLVVGPDPSVLRASVAGGLGAVAVVFGRPRLAFGLTMLAVILLLAVDPWYASRVAFQLSVAATLGIALASPALGAWLRERCRLPRALAEAVALSCAATIACTPLLVGLQPDQSALTVPLNVAVAPAAAVVGLVGPALALVAPLMPASAWPVALVCLFPAQGIAWLGRLSVERGWFVSWPEAPLGPGLAATACWGLPALILVRARAWVAHRGERPTHGGESVDHGGLRATHGDERVAHGDERAEEGGNRAQLTGARPWLGAARERVRRRRRARWWRLSLALCLALALAGGAGLWWGARRGGVLPAARDGDLLFCDVGQGDALALIGEGGAALLIDVGPRDAGAEACLARAGVQRLCGVLLTHLDADHVGGLEAVLAGRPGTPVLYSTADRPPPSAGARRAVAGDTLTCGTWRATVRLAPTSSEENDASLVIHAATTAGGGLELLDAGDLESRAAEAAVRAGAAAPEPAGPPRVLKLSHHGARNGGMALVDAFAPRLVLIGVGEGNDYGHPAAVTLDALAVRGVPALRTDLSGSILLRPGPQRDTNPSVSTSG
jgi:competence protein ComEC